MPEPLLYLQALGTSIVVSAVYVCAMFQMRRNAGSAWWNSACIVGLSLGIAGGCRVLSLHPAWPPVSALDRLLTIILPTALLIELIAGTGRGRARMAWFLRISLFAMTPRILFHGSVYLSGADSDWPLRQAMLAMILSAALLAGVWGLTVLLSRRSPGVSGPLALSLTIQCTGLTVMMAGYLKGGELAFPLSSSLLGVILAATLAVRRSSGRAELQTSAISSFGVVSLFGLLVIGRFFGRLSTGCALVLLFTPLLGWVTELPLLRDRKPWLRGSLRLLLVCIPLAIVLVLAKRTFDREMGPLL